MPGTLYLLTIRPAACLIASCIHTDMTKDKGAWAQGLVSPEPVDAYLPVMMRAQVMSHRIPVPEPDATLGL